MTMKLAPTKCEAPVPSLLSILLPSTASNCRAPNHIPGLRIAAGAGVFLPCHSSTVLRSADRRFKLVPSTPSYNLSIHNLITGPLAPNSSNPLRKLTHCHPRSLRHLPFHLSFLPSSCIPSRPPARSASSLHNIFPSSHSLCCCSSMPSSHTPPLPIRIRP